MTSFEPFAEEWDSQRKKLLSVVPLFLQYAKGRVLDAGCGNGRNARVLAEKAEVFAVDVSDKLVALAKKNLEGKKVKVQKADLAELPFEDSFFDSVFCLAVLHHFRRKEQPVVLKELRRVLKRDGVLCVSVWNRYQRRFRSKPKELNVPWKGHERYYYFFDEDELKTLLEENGFKVAELFYEKGGTIAEKTIAENLCVIAVKQQRFINRQINVGGKEGRKERGKGKSD